MLGVSPSAVQLTQGVDQEKIEVAVRLILEAIGEDPDRQGLLDTPRRVAAMYSEIMAGLFTDASSVLATRFQVDHDEMVLVKDIPFFSICEHHLVPFFGQAHVAYLPGHGVVTGLSKLARLVDLSAKKPQIQEKLTNEVADALEAELSPEGVLVAIKAEHLCMTMRGINKPGSQTVTIATRGAYREANRADSVLRLLQL
jgi:GTP cyclohydrolase I